MTYILAILVLTVKIPLFVLKTVLKNRIILLAVIVVIGYFVVTNAISNRSSTPQPQATAYQTIAPPKNIAPLVIQTASRVYYVADFTETPEVITLQRWFEYNAKAWQENTAPLPLEKARIKIYSR